MSKLSSKIQQWVSGLTAKIRAATLFLVAHNNKERRGFIVGFLAGLALLAVGGCVGWWYGSGHGRTVTRMTDLRRLGMAVTRTAANAKPVMVAGRRVVHVPSRFPLAKRRHLMGARSSLLSDGRPRSANARRTTPVQLHHYQLTPDKDRDSWWLVLFVSELPKFRLRSDSQHPYLLQLYNTVYPKDDIAFNSEYHVRDNQTVGPIKALRWERDIADTKMILELNGSDKQQRDYIIAKIESEGAASRPDRSNMTDPLARSGAATDAAAAYANDAKIKIQLVKVAGEGQIVHNPNLHSWHSGELMVDSDHGFTATTSRYLASSAPMADFDQSKTSQSSQQLQQQRPDQPDQPGQPFLQSHQPQLPAPNDVASHEDFVVRPVRSAMSRHDRLALIMQQVDDRLENNDIAGAIQKLYTAVGEFDADNEATVMLASLLFETGKLREAESVLDQGLRRAPRDLVLNELKAKVLIDDGLYQMARECLMQIVTPNDLKHASVNSLALLGLVDYQLGRFAESVVVYHELTLKEPGKAAWWLGLGMALEEIGKPDAAKAAYRQGLAIEGVPLEMRESLSEKLYLIEHHKIEQRPRSVQHQPSNSNSKTDAIRSVTDDRLTAVKPVATKQEQTNELIH